MGWRLHSRLIATGPAIPPATTSKGANIMEQSIRDWIIEARANGCRTDQPDEIAARWFDVADDLLALLKTISPDETKG